MTYIFKQMLLLTDVFENFRTKCLEDYGLDPAHYITLPNFSWDAMLLKSGIELDLIYDEEVYIKQQSTGFAVECAKCPTER